MERVLITGAAGFLGRPCLDAAIPLASEVHAVVRPGTFLAVPDVAVHPTDLLDRDAVADLMAKVAPTHLLHLAWVTAPRTYWQSPENLAWVGASLHLVAEFARRGGERVVCAGSCAEYDWTTGHCDEERTDLKPATLYGTSKNATREVVEKFCPSQKVSAAWGRLFFLYGPREHPRRLVSSVGRSLLAGREAQCSPGTQQRDFLHCHDAASALVQLLQSDVWGAVNIASGTTVAVAEVVQALGVLAGRPDLVKLGALPSAENEPPILAASANRIHAEVGWRPHFDLKAGLEDTLNWWRTHDRTSIAA